MIGNMFTSLCQWCLLQETGQAACVPQEKGDASPAFVSDLLINEWLFSHIPVSVFCIIAPLFRQANFHPRQRIKKQRYYFANKGPSTQGYGFSCGHVWMWELDYKESWVPKNWCFWTVVLKKILQSPLDCKEIQPVHPKGDQSWMFIGRTDAEVETPILWPPNAKSWLIWKDPDAG